MTSLCYIISKTPFYIWIILFYLFFIGIKNMQPRIIVSYPKLIIIPLIFLSMQYKVFLSNDVYVFCSTIFIAAIISFLITKKDNRITVIKNTQSIEMPGNSYMLLILISFFIIQYSFGMLRFINPELFARYSMIKNIISGLFAGYFIGKNSYCVYKYLTTNNNN